MPNRLFWAVLSRMWLCWCEELVIVKPERSISFGNAA